MLQVVTCEIVERLLGGSVFKEYHPTRVIGDKIPHLDLFDQEFSYKHLRKFDCAAYLHAPKEKCGKWGPASPLCRFVGYCATNEQYRFVDARTKKLVVSATAVFQVHEVCQLDNGIVKAVQISDNVIYVDMDLNQSKEAAQIVEVGGVNEVHEAALNRNEEVPVAQAQP